MVELDGAPLTPALLAPWRRWAAARSPSRSPEYLDVYRAVGYHTHTLLASMDDAADLVSALRHNIEEHGPADIRLILMLRARGLRAVSGRASTGGAGERD